MKKIYFSGLMALALLCSCNKEVVNSPVVKPAEDATGHYVTRSVVIGDATTKATSAFAGEEAINDATIFVYQTNVETGTTIDYERKYISGNTTTFDLYFSDQTEYQYSFAVWANMGDLADEPVAGDIKFADEKDDDLQMRGETNNVKEADAETVGVSLVRYVGKTIIDGITLDWTHDMNALKTFEILEIYVANAAADDAAAPVATYNLNGVYNEEAAQINHFLWDDVASYVLDNGAKYSQAHYFYAYESATTEVVIKAELDDEVMYYHFPINPTDNTVKQYSVTIKQIGASDPLGELPEETIVVSTVTLSVEEWGNQTPGDVSFEGGDVTVTDRP